MLYNIFFYVVQNLLCQIFIVPLQRNSIVNYTTLIFNIMSNKLTKNDSMSEVDMLDFEKKKPLLIKHLEFITDKLMEIAGLTNATEEEKNDLLRTCYNQVGKHMLSGEEWRVRGCVVKSYEHGYLFWNDGGIIVLYCREQVKQIQLSLFAL